MPFAADPHNVSQQLCYVDTEVLILLNVYLVDQQLYNCIVVEPLQVEGGGEGRGGEWRGGEWSGVEGRGVEWSGGEWSGVEGSGGEGSGIMGWNGMQGVVEYSEYAYKTQYSHTHKSHYTYKLTIAKSSLAWSVSGAANIWRRRSVKADVLRWARKEGRKSSLAKMNCITCGNNVKEL